MIPAMWPAKLARNLCIEEICSGLRIRARFRLRLFRQNERRFVEKIFEPKLSEEDLVALRVRAVLELRKNGKVWFCNSYRML